MRPVLSPMGLHGFFLVGSAFAMWVAVPSRAGEVSLQWLPQARMEYEGTGHREHPNGWELKVKPWTAMGGLRWRGSLSPSLAAQVQYWNNRPTFAHTFGNSAGPGADQFSQSKLTLRSLWMDMRVPWAEGSLEAVMGVNGAHQTIVQKDVVFSGTEEPGVSRESQWAVGGHLGVHARSQIRRPASRGWVPYGDGEFLIGHYFWTRNRLRTHSGSVDRGGYAYVLRAEGGAAWPRWRVGAGYTRQLYEIFVPAGRPFTPGSVSGATASLPINKTDVFGFFLVVTRVY